MPQDEASLDLFGAVDGVELIQKTPLFASLGFEETQRLAELTRIETAPRGHLIIEQDSLGQALYIVREGEVTVWRRDSGGQRDRITTLGVGELFGEMSLIEDALASVDVEVSSDEAAFVVVPRDGFQLMLESNDRLAARIYKAFCRTLSDRLRHMTTRYAELHDEPAR